MNEVFETKHLQGKKISVYCNNGTEFAGLCTASSDAVIKILKEGEKDEMVISVANIFSYVIHGEGCTGGYSGLKVYVCKNLGISCFGRVKLSASPLKIEDMGCGVCKAKTVNGTGFNCDFGCVGAMEVIPSKVQKLLFDGMLVIKNQKEKPKDVGN